MSEQGDAPLKAELESTYNVKLVPVKDGFYKIYRGGFQHGVIDRGEVYLCMKLRDIKMVLDEYTANVDPDYWTKELTDE